jgi:hypothetical protein
VGSGLIPEKSLPRRRKKKGRIDFVKKLSWTLCYFQVVLPFERLPHIQSKNPWKNSGAGLRET